MKYQLALIAIAMLSTLAIQEKSFASKTLSTQMLVEKSADRQVILVDRDKMMNTLTPLNSGASIQHIAQANNSPDNYIHQAMRKSESGDKKGAIDDYTKAIDLNPKDVSIYVSRAMERSDFGDKQGAISDYTQAIKLEPRSAEIYLGRSSARSSIGDKPGAIADLTKAADLFRQQGQTNLYQQTMGAISKLTSVPAQKTKAPESPTPAKKTKVSEGPLF